MAAKLLKLSAATLLNAALGDYLLVDFEEGSVKHVPAEMFEQVKSRTPKRAGSRSFGPRVQLPADTIKRIRDNVQTTVEALPGIRSTDLYSLTEGATLLKRAAFNKHLEYMAREGRIERRPVGGSMEHTLWEYHPVAK